MMSDAALVLGARGGDEAAFEELAERLRDSIEFLARQYFVPDGDPDDLIQEGMYGLYKAVRDYRPDRGSGFRNFAEVCIYRQVITAVKKSTRGNHGPLNFYTSLDARPPGASEHSEATLAGALPGPASDDPAETVCAREQFVALLDATGDLSPLERAALAAVVGGESYEVAAARLGVTVKQVDNAIQRARRKLLKVAASDGSQAAPDGSPRPTAAAEAEPTSRDLVEAFLWRHPRSTAKQVADGVGLSYAYVGAMLKRWGPGLARARAPRGKGWVWYMVSRKVAA